MVKMESNTFHAAIEGKINPHPGGHIQRLRGPSPGIISRRRRRLSEPGPGLGGSRERFCLLHSLQLLFR